MCKDNVIIMLGEGRCCSGRKLIHPEGITAAASGIDGMGSDQWNQMVPL